MKKPRAKPKKKCDALSEISTTTQSWLREDEKADAKAWFEKFARVCVGIDERYLPFFLLMLEDVAVHRLLCHRLDQRLGDSGPALAACELALESRRKLRNSVLDTVTLMNKINVAPPLTFVDEMAEIIGGAEGVMDDAKAYQVAFTERFGDMAFDTDNREHVEFDRAWDAEVENDGT